VAVNHVWKLLFGNGWSGLWTTLACAENGRAIRVARWLAAGFAASWAGPQGSDPVHGDFGDLGGHHATDGLRSGSDNRLLARQNRFRVEAKSSATSTWP
jgi:hypothetical protein